MESWTGKRARLVGVGRGYPRFGHECVVLDDTYSSSNNEHFLRVRFDDGNIEYMYSYHFELIDDEDNKPLPLPG